MASPTVRHGRRGQRSGRFRDSVCGAATVRLRTPQNPHLHAVSLGVHSPSPCSAPHGPKSDVRDAQGLQIPTLMASAATIFDRHFLSNHLDPPIMRPCASRPFFLFLQPGTPPSSLPFPRIPHSPSPSPRILSAPPHGAVVSLIFMSKHRPAPHCRFVRCFRGCEVRCGGSWQSQKPNHILIQEDGGEGNAERSQKETEARTRALRQTGQKPRSAPGNWRMEIFTVPFPSLLHVLISIPAFPGHDRPPWSPRTSSTPAKSAWGKCPGRGGRVAKGNMDKSMRTERWPAGDAAAGIWPSEDVIMSSNINGAGRTKEPCGVAPLK